MFEDIKKTLKEAENSFEKIQEVEGSDFRKHENIIMYMEMHLAEAIMQEEILDHKKLANIILAASDKE